MCRITNAMFDDGNTLGPPDIHSYLNRVMYNQRNKFDPFWNTLVLGGVKNGVKYLGNVRVENSTKMTAISNCFTKH